MKFVSILKSCLKRNKIFFETITATMLTIMALTVSISSLRLSKQQSQMTKLSNQPFFIWDSQKYDIVLSNDGPRADNIDVEFRRYAKAAVFTSDRIKYKLVERKLFLYEEYDWPENNTTGKIQAYPMRNIWNKDTELRNMFENRWASKNANITSAEIQIHTIAKISYWDMYGNKGNQFFSLDPIWGNPRLQDDDGAREFKRIDSLVLMESNLSKACDEIILELNK